MTPEQIKATGWDSKAGATLIHPDATVGTCRGRGNAARVIDYFAISSRAEGIVASVATVMKPFAPHRPVRLKLRNNLQQAQALVMRMPPALPAELPVGCMPPPPDYTLASQAAQRAVKVALEATKARTVRQALYYGHKCWLNTVEKELARMTQTDLGRYGTRAQEPRPEWRPVLPRPPRPAAECFALRRRQGGQRTPWMTSLQH